MLTLLYTGVGSGSEYAILWSSCEKVHTFALTIHSRWTIGLTRKYEDSRSSFFALCSFVFSTRISSGGHLTHCHADILRTPRLPRCDTEQLLISRFIASSRGYPSSLLILSFERGSPAGRPLALHASLLVGPRRTCLHKQHLRKCVINSVTHPC